MLRSFGYEVLEASDGEEALRLIGAKAGSIHLVLTDIVMPRMSGRELGERLAVLSPDTRIAFMTGYEPPDDFGLRGDALIVRKPFTPRDLVRRVRGFSDGGGKTAEPG